MAHIARQKDILLDILFITAGAAVYATAVTALTAPNNIAPGGVTGLCTMLNFMFGTPIGLMSFFINIPIILWAVVDIGYKLVVRTMAAIVLSSLFIDLFTGFMPVYSGNPILVAVFSGVGHRYGGKAPGAPSAPYVHGQADVGPGRRDSSPVGGGLRQH